MVDESKNIAYITRIYTVRNTISLVEAELVGEKGICHLQDSYFRYDHYATCAATVTRRIQTRISCTENPFVKKTRGISANVLTLFIRYCVYCIIVKLNLKNWFLLIMNSQILPINNNYSYFDHMINNEYCNCTFLTFQRDYSIILCFLSRIS